MLLTQFKPEIFENMYYFVGGDTLLQVCIYNVTHATDGLRAMLFTKIKIRPMLLLLLPAMVGGCTTMEAQNRERAAHQAEVSYMQEQNRKLSGRIDDLELQIDQLHRDLDRVRESARLGQDAERKASDQRLDQLEQQLAQLNQARAGDRQQIVDQLSKQMAKVMQSARPAAPSRSGVSEYGREHLVEPGQTLSEIARAYGVSIQAVIKANNMSNPNALRAGQTLFIPD